MHTKLSPSSPHTPLSPLANAPSPHLCSPSFTSPLPLSLPPPLSLSLPLPILQSSIPSPVSSPPLSIYIYIFKVWKRNASVIQKP